MILLGNAVQSLDRLISLTRRDQDEQEFDCTMRILFLTHYFYPEGNAPATRVYEFCRRWVALGHDVTVITCAPNVPNGVVYEGYRNRLYQQEVVEGVKVIRVWTYLAANRGTTKRIINFLSYMLSSVIACLGLQRPDVIVSTSPQFFCGWAGVISRKLRRVPMVLDVRDLWPAAIVAVGAITNRHIVHVLERMELAMYAGADHIVTVGKGYREQLLARGVRPERLSIVPNGVDAERLRPRPRSAVFARRLGLEGKFVCSYVGTIGLASGLEVVLQAGHILHERQRDDIVFLLVGDGACRADLERQARRDGLENVHFVGQQDKHLIPDFLAASDVCLAHLRRRESFKTVYPSKMFEAAAMARPIVLGVEGHAARLIRKAGCGLCIEPENAVELADAVSRLADDLSLRQRLGRAGRNYVVEHHALPDLARTYLAILKAVVAGHATPICRA